MTMILECPLRTYVFSYSLLLLFSYTQHKILELIVLKLLNLQYNMFSMYSDQLNPTIDFQLILVKFKKIQNKHFSIT